jgi:hypothetical protein
MTREPQQADMHFIWFGVLALSGGGWRLAMTIQSFHSLRLGSSQSKTMTIRFWLLVICWWHCVLTQPLNMDQHTALMSVYDGLGSLP